jgi:hypothetical protein
MHMGIGIAGPHDVRTGSSMCRWKAGRFRIKGPHDHPVWTDCDQRRCLVVGIGVASLCCSSEHIGDTGNYVCWLRLVFSKVLHPLHRSRIGAHWGSVSLCFGMHVQEFVPGRSSINFLSGPISAILACLAISAGPADMASAIFVAVGRLLNREPVPALPSMLICAGAAPVDANARSNSSLLE